MVLKGVNNRCKYITMLVGKAPGNFSITQFTLR